ncbi:glycoside hydrolase family 88 protein [Paenibacillus ferrarius]|uniref:glycoside hydrolase family 88 protein n=1 Tax=Paenibacillus ferrarius TaxID=1469647 RepID=UPI003D27BFE6
MGSNRHELIYALADRIEMPTLVVPEGKRLPFGWCSFVVPPANNSNKGSFLYWADPDDVATSNEVSEGSVYFRVTVALDVREEKSVEVRLASSGRIIGVLDIRYAYVFQPFQIELSREDAQLARCEGVELRMATGSEPLWLFMERECSLPSTLFVPHLLFDDNNQEVEQRLNSFLERMLSLDVVQEFSWMGGCVMDGLLALGELDRSLLPPGSTPREALIRQLRLFLDESGQLTYENPKSVPADGRILDIECTLPFGAIAKLWPDHPTLELALAFWKGHTGTDGAIQDGSLISAEGSYTVAYPLAVLARERGDMEIAALARRQLLSRRDRLTVGNDLFLRHERHGEDGCHTFRNWARAYAWYMLGLAHTLKELKAMSVGSREYTNKYQTLASVEEAELCEEFIRIAHIAIYHQRKDGLWANFIDEPTITADTSGSAGIAAALAMGVRYGWLEPVASEAAEHAFAALKMRLTPDGLLTGVSQSNRGGEKLQRGDYRVISQMAMGLMAQLYATLLFIKQS